MQYVVKHGNLLYSNSGKFVTDINQAVLFPNRQEARKTNAILNEIGKKVKVYKVQLSPVSYERS